MQGIFRYLTWNDDLEVYLRHGWEPVELGSYHDQYGLGVFFRCTND